MSFIGTVLVAVVIGGVLLFNYSAGKLNKRCDEIMENLERKNYE